ncbi:redox-sensitive bicupin YhaK (pirin superfamily) [Xanthomonas arboricola]
MTTLIAPRVHDIGGLEVRRAVPTLQARSVGPFVFVDHMGPAVLEPDHGIDVRPHPHIGLATVTFLWSGEIGHRDTLGSDQVIRPGDVNWMTAGRGIAHSERTPGPERARTHALHGMQTWIALPRSAEETAPAFHHHAAASLPQQRRDGVWLRVIAGRAYGEESPVQVFSGTLNVALDLQPDAEIDLDTGHAERALYILEGEAQLDGADVPARHLIVPSPGSRGRLRQDAAQGDAARRRAAGWPAPPVVELRFQLQGAHRAGQGRLAGRSLRQHSRRRQGIHPAAGNPGAQAGQLPLITGCRAQAPRNPPRSRNGSAGAHDRLQAGLRIALELAATPVIVMSP